MTPFATTLTTLFGGQSVSFTVPHDPVGYYAVGKCPNWKRMKAYHSYLAIVRNYAAAAGLRLPLIATKDRPLLISVVCHFRTGVHCDPGNVQKGICDALFYRPKGLPKQADVPVNGDKYSGGLFLPPLYDKTKPRVEVWITVNAVQGGK